jgi:hypothetical protein
MQFSARPVILHQCLLSEICAGKIAKLGGYAASMPRRNSQMDKANCPAVDLVKRRPRILHKWKKDNAIGFIGSIKHHLRGIHSD